MAKKGQHVIVNTYFDCPFCGLAAIAGMTPRPFAGHALPQCEKFKELEPTDHLKAVNDKRAQSATS